MDEEAITQETYNRIAEKWAAEHNETDYWQKEFEIFTKLLPQGKILDVGAGRGEFLSKAKNTNRWQCFGTETSRYAV